MGCSSILESSSSLEMGPKLFRLSGSRPGFFRMGVIVVNLRVLKEMLMWDEGGGTDFDENGSWDGVQVMGFMMEMSLETLDEDWDGKDEEVEN